MSIHVAIEHTTVYRFDRAVELGPHVVRLRPAPHCRTPVLAYSLNVEPSTHFLNWQQDPFGNYLARLVFLEKARELTVTVDLVADMTVINPFDFFLDEDAQHVPFTYDDDLRRDLAPYLEVTAPGGPLVDAWLADVPRLASDGERWRTNDFLVALNQRLAEDISYSIRMEPGVQTPEETMEKRNGSCRDTAWLLVQLLRRLGMAARFVSGYLVQLTADMPALDGPSGPTADFTDLHAWAELYVPGAGWLGLDPTSGLFAGEGHLPLACTPSPSSAAPITGSTGPCEVEFEFTNTVSRIHEDPRVTLPYSDAQWADIDALGRDVDRRLVEGDVRLTQGGEPTFVSASDFESPQWTTDADGPDKRAKAAELTDRLVEQFAPGGLIHHGQGKWYPGEPLPRWQLAVYWRPDGVPLWRERALAAETSSTGSHTDDDAARVAHELAATLGVERDHLLPAFEDPLYQHWQEALGNPISATPADRPAGWVLPLHWAEDGQWGTSRWRFRRGELYLVPGDSPIGLRLPLGSIDGMPEPAVQLVDRSSFEPRPPLPIPERSITTQPAGAPAPSAPVALVPPSALCIEVRDGHVHVFLPPLVAAEQFCELVAATEHAASNAGLAVAIEGYPPPTDPRLRQIVVAPDPGVIEVNVQPASSWDELVDITTTLYDHARSVGLATETFDLDGRHNGTGGGNHITLGGPTPADSPLLRRPDVLRSLVTFWQHHPSLSYLFSGRFVGPTSQAPRVDEGRDEYLHDLDLAFAELDRQGSVYDGHPPPWLVDRLLRHLLVDVTGNTHRAEFCIDKLFSPDSERGRLGLVELRAFEMPPHPRMAMVQSLLLRALVSRFWSEPYRGRLVRWDTELHDRFLLSHGARTDIAEVIDDLRHRGYPFEHAWIDPFLEFRFPRIGSVQIGDIELTLRNAIEPWDVLGEEVRSTGTTRFVDASTERIEVHVAGVTDTRHLVTCNGVLVPLRSTGMHDELVAGVRFKAWAPPSARHPTVPIHTPLVFDIVDRWNDRAIGGCTYHASHPGGLAYDTFPVNANEAEARRASRFTPFGHTPGALTADRLAAIDSSSRDPEYPWTLDLRHLSPG